MEDLHADVLRPAESLGEVMTGIQGYLADCSKALHEGFLTNPEQSPRSLWGLLTALTKLLRLAYGQKIKPNYIFALVMTGPTKWSTHEVPEQSPRSLWGLLTALTKLLRLVKHQAQQND